jgi:hypothetical protein
LTNLISHYPDQKEEFISQLPEILMSDKGAPDHFWNLLMVADVVPEHQLSQLIKEAESLVQELNAEFKVQYLSQIVKYLAEEEKVAVIDDAIESARDIEDPIFRAKSMGFLMSVLPDHLRSPIASEAWTGLIA